MKNILILGSNGFVGRSLVDYFNSQHGFRVFGTVRGSHSKDNNEAIQFDIDKIKDLVKIISDKSIDIVINCIAMANVDQCDKNRDLSIRINYTFVKELVDLLNEIDVKLINFSTNAVYSGENPLYAEDSEQLPKNSYGEDKKKADAYVEEHSSNFVIARIMTLFGVPHVDSRTNPSDFIVKNLQAGKETYLVADVYNNFLYIKDLVKVIHILIMNDANGAFNISGNEVYNRYEFGLIIAKTLGLTDELIISCTSDKFGMMSSRAPNTSFCNEKVKCATKMEFMTIQEAIKDAYQ